MHILSKHRCAMYSLEAPFTAPVLHDDMQDMLLADWHVVMLACTVNLGKGEVAENHSVDLPLNGGKPTLAGLQRAFG